ncbi:MFS transporter [Kribbella shirazensis]|uniref:MFS family permease n=1 Tax=Kribbella shirazensis TaxID=1105143 RepID=A0A7X5ZZ72_9ACTN|nr:MFS transporter [Kribbella shirazensis]NIK55638.1 MFS family permease [Kribbella shirazensis]
MQDFIPLYPLYQLFFADHGLSAAQISTLFVIWSATGFVLEVPSGAWADSYSRRKLLILGALLGGLGYAAWITLPSYAGFALGFALWGTSSALISGTFEAFVYDELAARDRTARYATLLGRARSGSFVMNLAATALAAPLFDLGGYTLAGVVSVLSCLAQAVVAWSLPEARPVEAARESDEPGARAAFGNYLHMLRSGVSEVLTSRVVRRSVLLVALLGGFLAFDEYFPLLARETGAATGVIPLLIAGTVAAQAIGGALAGPAYKLPAATFAVGMAATAVLIATGALSGSAWGFLPIAIGYGVMQLVIVVSESRLQDAITGPARATVTSVSGLFAEVSAIAVYGGFALGSMWFTMSILVAALTIPVLLTAFVVPVALPAPRSSSAAEVSEP